MINPYQTSMYQTSLFENSAFDMTSLTASINLLPNMYGKDADSSTLCNLYDEFEITPKVVSFALRTTTTDVKKKCMEVVRHIEDNLRGETWGRYRKHPWAQKLAGSCFKAHLLLR